MFWVGVALTAACFAVAALGLIGEFLGWWHDLGEWLTVGGSLLGLLLGATAYFTGATRNQVRGVAVAVQEGNGRLESIARGVGTANGTLDTVNQKLDTANDSLGTVNQKLDTANDSLGTANLKLDAIAGAVAEGNTKLDALHADFDRAIALADRQLDEEEEQSALLAEIRDRLPRAGPP